MRSKMKFRYLPNGTLVDETSENDRLFQGAVGVSEYAIVMDESVPKEEQWRDTDIVFINIKRPDSQEAQIRLNKTAEGWGQTTNGWETDIMVPESGTAKLKVSFLARRYSTVQGMDVVVTRPTEQVEVLVYPSAGYVPQGIQIEAEEYIYRQLQELEVETLETREKTNQAFDKAVGAETIANSTISKSDEALSTSTESLSKSNDAIAATEQLNTALQAEKIRATAAEALLQANIESEARTRADEDENLASDAENKLVESKC